MRTIIKPVSEAETAFVQKLLKSAGHLPRSIRRLLRAPAKRIGCTAPPPSKNPSTATEAELKELHDDCSEMLRADCKGVA